VVKNDKDGKPRAHLRLVKTLAVQGDDVLLRSGLKAGEQVAASGSFKLREAVLVAAAASSSSAAATAVK
ncbi:MAG TPA: efflux transporter periplasmic adaptor subunit, partial [Prosthecobacter sp.]